VRVLFATAELAPVAAVGGLAHAAAGLVRELRAQGVDVEVALPDYAGLHLAGEQSFVLETPPWASPAVVRRGSHPAFGPLTLVWTPVIPRPHPYVDERGEGWPDNDVRFLSFSAVVAALAFATRPDVLHLNDWHTAAATAWTAGEVPTVLSIHNLAHQGWTGLEWLERLGPRAAAFLRDGACNPLAGAIALADAIVVVSPTYREEVLRPETGAGLDGLLREREHALVGIRNGIDVDIWDPSRDAHVPAPFDADDPTGKALARAALCERVGLPERPGPLAVAVTRLTHQKGIDLLLPILEDLEELDAQVAILGAGEELLVRALREAAASHSASVAFVEGYDEPLSHLYFAGGDLLLMPSRFEPCGLAQMQAMRYGTLPVVTDVGGLHDTVIDLDEDPERGTGWRAATPDTLAFRDALERTIRGWWNPAVREGARRRAMTADWSWREPAAAHVELYRSL
jgi:starch synthase